MHLIWKKVDCALFGWRYELTGLPDNRDIASARKHNGRYLAHGFIGDRYLSHCAGTLKAAIARLNKEIDRRSIGLLGVDVVSFETATDD